MIHPPDLQALVKKWQPILRLQDWDFRIEYVRHFQIDEGKGGTVGFNTNKRIAHIKIIALADYPSTPDPAMIPQDVEITVVHEMVHVLFALVDDYEKMSLTLFEQAVHVLSTALVNLDRRTTEAVPAPSPAR